MNVKKYVLTKFVCLLSVVVMGGMLGACASAGEGDDTPSVDASTATTIDAPVTPTADANRSQPDARVFNTVDAATSNPADANMSTGPDAGGGLFCNGPADCPAPGECCFSLGGPGACVPGDDSLGVCIPT